MINATPVQYGMMQQEHRVKQIMWDDIQQLKKDVQKLADAIAHIQKFLRDTHP